MIRKYYMRRVYKAFNSWAPQYENEVVPKLIKRGYSYPELAELITNTLELREGRTAIELGVGTGVLGKEVRNRSNASLIGVDISREMLNIAAQKNVYDYLINSSAEEIHLDGQCVDAIFSAFMFHSVYNQKQALCEIGRLLSKKGKAVIVDLFPSDRSSAIQKLFRGYFHSIKYEYGAPANYKSIESVHKMLERSGFSILDHGQLGEDKNYIHYYFSIERGD
ncbi:class I SAM-dependent DNA methyltransferase [Paenibacillus sp. TH7-28]